MPESPRDICLRCNQSVCLDAKGRYIEHAYITEEHLFQNCPNSGKTPPKKGLCGDCACSVPLDEEMNFGYHELPGGKECPSSGKPASLWWPNTPEEPPSPTQRFPTQTLYARINGVDVTFLIEHKMPVDFSKLPTIKLLVSSSDYTFSFGGIDVG